jgi:hypothetical protein
MVLTPDSVCEMLFVLLRQCFDVCEGAASFGGEVQGVRTPVGFGPSTVDEFSRLEIIQ